MGSKVKQDKRSRPKLKSIKSKAYDMNSKRRLAKFGNKQKKGHAGAAVMFVTRQRALKKLQVSLKDFRRLCILKGIYPRQPRNKVTTKVTYHVKDIAFLAHEPLLAKFWDMKAYMKKVRRKAFRKETSDAIRLMENKPTYSLDHLVKERYPRFQDSLADMDDALCLLHLFANMTQVGHVTAARVANCERLCREWQLYVVMSRSLRKTFVSVKGIYYQAEVMGETITWIVPHKFAQNKPTEVDFRVMSTFLEFYETLAGFVLYKLYHTQGKQYPPVLNKAVDSKGGHLGAIVPEALTAAEETPAAAAAPASAEDEEAPQLDGAEKSKAKAKAKAAAEAETEQQKASKKRLRSLSSKLQEIQEADKDEDEDEGEDEAETKSDNEGLNAEENEVFAEDEQAKAIKQNSALIEAQTNLLNGLVFFLSREVPFEPLEFVIRAFGGEALSADTGAEATDAKVTHVVTDRPTVKRENKQAEYVQPQWVFDSVNYRIKMPVARYSPEVELPPHLSPFVNNEAVGYTPEFIEEVHKLQAAAGVAPEEVAPPELLRDRIQRSDDISPEDEAAIVEEEMDEADEEAFVDEIQDELLGKKKGKKDAKKQKAKKRAREAEAEAEAEAESDVAEQSKTEADASSAAEEPKAKKAKKQAKKKQAAVEEEQKSADEDESEDETPVKAKKKAAKKKAAQDEDGDEEEPATDKKKKKKSSFVPSKRFVGAKPGYVFKVGEDGAGYYPDLFANRKVTFRANKVVSKRQQRMADKREELERSKMIMTGKARRLYGKMQHGIERKKYNAKRLTERRKKKN